MSGLRDQLQVTLGSRYTLQRELGGGGMAQVFLAEETALGRPVVVKVLDASMTEELSAERFAREIRLLARLQHPNIVPVLTAGAAGGSPYYTMPYVDGETLRSRLGRSDRIPLSEAIALLRDMARALAYAHARGIVHRDIKPENVLLADDVVVVADFGIAKALDAARTREAGNATLTQIGFTVGTPAYVAPEQAAGDPAVDHRADLYAWGVVAYEVLSGTHPFPTRRSPHALIVAHMTETPVSLGERCPDLPQQLVSLVTRCLAKDMADRPAQARDLIDVLDAMSRGALQAAPEKPSVVVLPMVNTSGDPENEHFSDGLTDELIGALGKLGSLRVIGRTSSFALKHLGLDIRAIAAKLGVSSVLEGTVRRAGRRLKVTAQLINARDEAVLWGESYDRELSDIFAVQEEIARAIVDALRVRLGGAGQEHGRLAAAPVDLEAYELYLKGRHVSRRLTPGDLARAIDYFRQCITRDPGYARAYASLADAFIMHMVFGARAPGDIVDEARRTAMAAVALDGGLADAHWALGHVRWALEFDFPAGLREFDHALSLDPGHSEARHLRAIMLLDLGRFDEAIDELTRTLAADPLLAPARMTLGRVFLSMGRLDEAIQCEREALELSPGFSYARGHLAHAYLLQGKGDDALREFRQAVVTGSASDVAQLAYGLAAVGRRSEAREQVADLLAQEGAQYLPPFHMAMAYVGLGEVDEAFRWVRRAVVERDPHVLGLAIVPAVQALKADARFHAIAREIGVIA